MAHYRYITLNDKRHVRFFTDENNLDYSKIVPLSIRNIAADMTTYFCLKCIKK